MPEKTLVPVIILSEAMLGVEVEVEMSFVASSYSNAEPYRSTEHEVVYPRNHYGLVFVTSMLVVRVISESESIV